MITSEQAKYLIELPKLIIEGEKILGEKTFSPPDPLQDRLYMVSEEDNDFSFFWVIDQRSKNSIKFTLHYQEEDANIGLLRIDYNGRHKNPEIANENVPELIKPFAGIWLDEYPGHIHFVIDGYEPLKWAIPLELDSFPIKNIINYTDIIDALKAFAKKINLRTNLQINAQTKML